MAHSARQRRVVSVAPVRIRPRLVDTSETKVRSLAFFRKSGFGGEIRHVYLSCNLNGHGHSH